MVDTSDYFRQFDEDLISSKLQEPTKLNLVENDDDEYKAILNSIDISTSPTRPIDDGSLDVEESTDRISQDFDDRDQDSLASQYYTLYPDIFDTEERQTEDGDTIVVPTKLNNITKAKELGIVDDRPDVRVPTGDAEIIPSSTLSGLELKYNTQAVATTRQKQSARADMSRLERGAAEREESEKFIEQEAEDAGLSVDDYIDTVLIPEQFTKEDSPVLHQLFKIPGTYEIMNATLTGLDMTADGFQDALQFVFEGMEKHTPELYDAYSKTMVGSKVDPKTMAGKGGREAFNFLIFSDTLAAGTSGVVTKAATKLAMSKESIKAMEAAQKLDKAINKQVNIKEGLMSGTKKKTQLAAAGKEVKVAREELAAATKAETVAIDARKAAVRAKAEKAVDKRLGRRLNIDRAKQATEMDTAAKQAAAKQKAEGASDLRQELIKQYEQKIGGRSADDIESIVDESKIISTTNQKGNLVVDYDKVRRVGLEVTEKASQFTGTKLKEILTGNTLETEAALQADILGDLTNPLLKSEKFDGIVAAAAELKERIPNAFDNKKTVIDNLFNLTVNKDLIAGDELVDILNKYGVSFEDYVLMVVGSGSEAGKTLQQLSLIKRMRPTNELIAKQEELTVEAQNRIKKGFQRFEGIRRGGLVSQIATAARNLQSAGVRAPLEGLGNIMDTALYNLSEEGVGAATKSLVSRANWQDSFRHMKYMFGQDATDVADYVEFILKQPELDKQFAMMFDNINEIQLSMGRGAAKQDQIARIVAEKRALAQRNKKKFNILKATEEATTEANRTILGAPIGSGTMGERARKGLDGLLSEMEDGVQILNVPNRWQEYLVRRGAFFGELERLTKREYGIDLVDALNDGKIRDLLNDATNVRPEGARSFKEIVGDATDRALDVTYAKQPDVAVFRHTSNFIVRNGLTVFLPFPRFMFNSMELMGQYAGGASIPLTRKVVGIVNPKFRGKLTAKDRQRISRNIVGATVVAPVAPAVIGGVGSLFVDKESEDPSISSQALDVITDGLISMSAFGAFYMVRTSEGAPSDYKQLPTDFIAPNTELDTTPQYPVRQFLYLAEATKRIQNGTFDDFFQARELYETFLGTNVRQGVGNSILNEVRDLFAGKDILASERTGRAAGDLLGSYLSSWAVPLGQIIEAERAAGYRGLNYKDAAVDPELGFTQAFKESLRKPLVQRGILRRKVRLDKDGKPRPEDVKLDKNEDGYIDEGELPKREFLFQADKRRVAPILRVAGGLNISTADPEAGEYIKSLGLTDFQLGSNSRVPSIRNFENGVLRLYIPDLVREAQSYERSLRRKYAKTKPIVKRKMTEQEYVNKSVRPFIEERIKGLKGKLSDGKKLKASAPAYVQASTAFRRLPPKIRGEAIDIFLETKGRVADGTDTADLLELAAIGKSMKIAYKGGD